MESQGDIIFYFCIVILHFDFYILHSQGRSSHAK